MEHLYSDIERRTGGNIYIGVVLTPDLSASTK